MLTTRHPTLNKSAIKILAVCGIALMLLALFTMSLHALVFEHTAFGMDFYTVYTAGRLAVLERQNPYSTVVGETVQLGVFGRLSNPDEDQVQFAYPVHALLLVLPALGMELEWALAYWMAFNLLLLLILPSLALSSERRWLILTLPIVPAFISGLLLGNNAVSVGVTFLAGWGLLTRTGKTSPWIQACAGVLLAWGTIKPQLIWLPLILALLVTIHRRLSWVLVGFGAACGIFLSLSWWITPDWPALWLVRLREYSQYAGSPPLAFIYPANFLSEPAARASGIAILLIAGLLTVYLLLRWWQSATAGKARSGPIYQANTLLVLAWCSLVTYLVNPANIVTFQDIVLVIPILLWVLQPGLSRRQALGIWGTTLVVAWVLFIGSVFRVNINLFYQLPLIAYSGIMLWAWLSTSRKPLTWKFGMKEKDLSTGKDAP